ncbi:Gfo/Idh/MocA family oxidoreductase [Desulfopila inferna]|uniref:Gfo/Idh/MocA family oxidoreductase n=1 Tax=Desulfopila inferna TaxID=468528 RepID=UPI001962B94E|nr:Gfo/Idh/MocA family oxidoreductase [Desulfopila inferna]MBM9605724.1 Gfo/Idh/MocA family oxidoreductase [Desulfopila inferna]
MNKNKLQIVLFGCGKMGRHHIKAISLQKEAELVAVADPVMKEEDVRESLPSNCRFYQDHRKLLQEVKPDVVHIVTPPATHAELAVAALNSGASIYVEKPFATEVKEAKSILALAEEKNLKVCAAHQVLFQESAEKMKDFLRLVGEIVHVESYFSFKTVRQNISEVDQLMDIMPHPVYLLLSALESEKDDEKSDPLKMEFVVIDPRGDVHATLTGRGKTGILAVTLRGRPVESYLKVVGTNGTVTADFVLSGVSRYLGPGFSAPAVALKPYVYAKQLIMGTTGSIFKLVFKKQKSYAGLSEIISRFYDSIRGNGEVPVSPESIYQTVKICEDIRRRLLEAEKIQEENAKKSLMSQEAGLPPLKKQEYVVVTGGTGFLGRVLVADLRNQGYAVRVLTRKIPQPSRRIAGVEYVAADLAREIPPEYLEGGGIMVHLAAETAGGKEEHQKNTIDATRNVLEATSRAKIKKIINISSIAVLKPGGKGPGGLSEASPVDYDNLGRGPYVWGKASAEKMLADSASRYGVESRTIRLGPLVDYADFTPPGRLGREIGPLYVAMGNRKSTISLCDVHTASAVIQYYIDSFEEAPPLLNLVEPETPSRADLIHRLKEKREELRVVWIPAPLLKVLSTGLQAFLKVARPKQTPLNVYAAFAAEKYDAALAGAVLNKINKN